MSVLLPLWEKVPPEKGADEGSRRDQKAIEPTEADSSSPDRETPHPSGFACHLLPQGEKGRWVERLSYDRCPRNSPILSTPRPFPEPTSSPHSRPVQTSPGPVAFVETVNSSHSGRRPGAPPALQPAATTDGRFRASATIPPPPGEGDRGALRRGGGGRAASREGPVPLMTSAPSTILRMVPLPRWGRNGIQTIQTIQTVYSRPTRTVALDTTP